MVGVMVYAVGFLRVVQVLALAAVMAMLFAAAYRQ